MMKHLGRSKAKDSTLAYYVNQLENLDKRFYEPLVSTSWARDIKLRAGISMSDEISSFIRQGFAGVGTLSNPSTPNQGGNMSWLSAETTAIPGVSVTGQKIALPIRLAGREVSYTSIELDRSQKTGQSIDVLKVNALNQLYNMNVDQMVYVGDVGVGATGLLNNAGITVSTAANGAAGTATWATKTPDEILADVNSLLESVWQSGVYDVCPNKLLLPPLQYSFLCSQKVSSAGNVSILKFLKENSIALNINGSELDIQPVKWLPGLGASSSDRMVAYTNSEDFVRYPMVPIRRETAYYQGIRFAAPYVWALGEMEFVYPETIAYVDGI